MKTSSFISQSRLSKARVFAVIFCVSTCAINSFADLITFTHTGTGSGTIGATSFANAAFTITDTADTTARSSFSTGFFINDLSASISIAGVGNFNFTSGTRTFVNNSLSLVGFSRSGAGQATNHVQPQFLARDRDLR